MLALTNHYKDVHNKTVQWACSNCNNFEYTTISSTSSHYTRCSRRAPRAVSAASEATSHTEPSSPGVEGSALNVSTFASQRHPTRPDGASVLLSRSQPSEWDEADLEALARLRLRLGPRIPARDLQQYFPAYAVQSVSRALQSARYRQVLRSVHEQGLLESPRRCSLDRGCSDQRTQEDLFNWGRILPQRQTHPSLGLASRLCPPTSSWTPPLMAVERAQRRGRLCKMNP